MTVRGCAYAGSKGVVWGPIKDMVHISHGPVGCGQYSWATRRNYYIGTTGIDAFGTMQFTSDFQEKDIVFGGDKKLEKIIDEVEDLFPLNKGISVQSECPIGLIGDDIEAVSKKKSKQDDRQDRSSRCAARASAASVQSLGHHIANDAIRDWVFDKTRPGQERLRGHALRRDHHRRLQHRRRRLVQPHPARGDGPARDRAVVRRRHHRRAGEHAQGQAQPDPLLPVDELHQPAHGREVRHSLARVQLLRPDQDRREPARDRRATSTTPSRRRPRRSSPSTRRSCRR